MDLTPFTLLEVLDTDHEDDGSGHTPSGGAVAALDEMMETEWTQKRYPDGLRGLNTAGINIEALKEQALVYLKHAREAKGI